MTIIGTRISVVSPCKQAVMWVNWHMKAIRHSPLQSLTKNHESLTKYLSQSKPYWAALWLLDMPFFCPPAHPSKPTIRHFFILQSTPAPVCLTSLPIPPQASIGKQSFVLLLSLPVPCTNLSPFAPGKKGPKRRQQRQWKGSEKEAVKTERYFCFSCSGWAQKVKDWCGKLEEKIAGGAIQFWAAYCLRSQGATWPKGQRWREEMGRRESWNIPVVVNAGAWILITWSWGWYNNHHFGYES